MGAANSHPPAAPGQECLPDDLSLLGVGVGYRTQLLKSTCPVPLGPGSLFSSSTPSKVPFFFLLWKAARAGEDDGPSLPS